jgi:hypothetical protein
LDFFFERDLLLEYFFVLIGLETVSLLRLGAIRAIEMNKFFFLLEKKGNDFFLVEEAIVIGIYFSPEEDILFGERLIMQFELF